MKVWTQRYIGCLLVSVGLPWTPEAGHLLTQSLASLPSPRCARDSSWASRSLLVHFPQDKPHGASEKWLRHSLRVHRRDERVLFCCLLFSSGWRQIQTLIMVVVTHNKSMLLRMRLAPQDVMSLQTGTFWNQPRSPETVNSMRPGSYTCFLDRRAGPQETFVDSMMTT